MNTTSTRFIALLLLLASGLSASAQWSTNWPAVSNAWWAWGPLAEDVNEAIQERFVAGNNNDADDKWQYYDNYTNVAWVGRTMLERFAAQIESDAPDWLNIAASRGTNENYHAWFAATNNFVFWTATGIIASVSATTNIEWSAETSNSFTLWPGRVYGETLDEMKAVLNKMTEGGADFGGPSGGTGLWKDWTMRFTGASGDTLGFGESPGDFVWADVKAQATNDYAAGGSFSFPGIATFGSYDGTFYDAFIRYARYRGLAFLPSLFGNDEQASKIHTYAYHKTHDQGTYSHNTFDSMGESVTNAAWTLVDSESASSVSITRVTDNTGPPVTPYDTNWVFVAEPASGDSDVIGYSVTGLRTVHDYAVTNGFQYVP